MSFEIHQIPLWEDNYIYLLNEKQTNTTAVIDPGEAQAVNHFLKQKKFKIRFNFNNSSSL